MLGVRDRYWLAGLLEGEGCFYAHRGTGTRRIYPAIRLVMTDRDVVQRVGDLLERPVYRNAVRPRRKVTYWLRVTGQQARGLMRDLHPLLGRRRQGRIEQLLRQWEAQ